MTKTRAGGRPAGRKVAFVLLASAVVLIAAGLAILLFWLFPVVEQGHDWQMIGQNPIGFWLVLAGAVLLAASILILARLRIPRPR